MFCFLQLQILPLAALRAEFLQRAKVRFFGLADPHMADLRVASNAVSGVDGFLPSWHSRVTLLAVCEKRKAGEDDAKADQFHAERLATEELFGGTGREKHHEHPREKDDNERLYVANDGNE